MLITTNDISKTLDLKFSAVSSSELVTLTSQIYQQYVFTFQPKYNMLVSEDSPLLLLGALGQRLHAELQHVPTVLVSAKVPLQEQRRGKRR